MRIYGVFVDATRTEVAAQELKAIAQALRNRQKTGRCAQGCRVVFFDWNLIGLLQESNDDASPLSPLAAFCVCQRLTSDNFRAECVSVIKHSHWDLISLLTFKGLF